MMHDQKPTTRPAEIYIVCPLSRFGTPSGECRTGQHIAVLFCRPLAGRERTFRHLILVSPIVCTSLRFIKQLLPEPPSFLSEPPPPLSPPPHAHLSRLERRNKRQLDSIGQRERRHQQEYQNSKRKCSRRRKLLLKK